MRILPVFLALSLTPLPALAEINAIVGDASWVARHGRAPTPEEDARERERIQTHLAWVEAELRRRLVPDLSPERKERRARLLDELAEYRGRARFPQNDRYSSRRPRFVGGDGEVCAVGQLIAVTAGRALTDAIARRFEYAYLLEIDEPRLAAWIETSGFSAIELAMIQPGYSRPVEPRAPEPWTETKLKVLLASFGPEVERCGEGERTRTIRISVRYERQEQEMAIASRPASGRVESCVEAALSRALSRARASAPRERLSATRTYRLGLSTDARARELASRAIDAQLPSLERCMPPTDRPGRRALMRVRIDEAGQLSLAGAQLPAPPRPGRGLLSMGSTWSREQVLACFGPIVSRLQVEPPSRALVLTHRLRWGGSFSSWNGVGLSTGR